MQGARPTVNAGPEELAEQLVDLGEVLAPHVRVVHGRGRRRRRRAAARGHLPQDRQLPRQPAAGLGVQVAPDERLEPAERVRRDGRACPHVGERRGAAVLGAPAQQPLAEGLRGRGGQRGAVRGRAAAAAVAVQVASQAAVAQHARRGRGPAVRAGGWRGAGSAGWGRCGRLGPQRRQDVQLVVAQQRPPHRRLEVKDRLPLGALVLRAPPARGSDAATRRISV